METESTGDEVLLKGELWSALIGDDDSVELRRETSYAADPPEGIPALDDCIGADMDAKVATP